MSVYFYIPKELWPDPFPQMENETWTGFSKGIYCWTLQTYFKLRKNNVDCFLVNNLPPKGIIISHRAGLSDSIIPQKGQYLVCIQADWSRHPFAHAHICQNRSQTKSSGVPRIDRIFMPGKTYFVHLWPQPGILPRNQQRKTELQTISYYGLEYNLTHDLKTREWSDFLEMNGVDWNIVTDTKRWSDYRETDAVIFIRDFKGRLHIDKPATKLYNAWIAGVLPICTPESAYMDETDSNHNAVVVRSMEELKSHIVRIKNDSLAFGNYLKQNKKKRQDYTEKRIVQEWVSILELLSEEQKNSEKNRTFIFMRKTSKLLHVSVDKVRSNMKNLSNWHNVI